MMCQCPAILPIFMHVLMVCYDLRLRPDERHRGQWFVVGVGVQNHVGVGVELILEANPPHV